MKKLLILLLGVSLTSFAQTNVGIEEGRYYFEDPSTISTVAKRAFDGDLRTISTHFSNPFNLGVIMWKEVDIDSITIHYQSYNGSCGAAVQVSYVGMENTIPPYTWKTDYELIGTFFSSCDGGSITFKKPILFAKGMYFKFSMGAGINPPHIKELQIWGDVSTVTSIEEVKEEQKKIIGFFDMQGRVAQEDTKGLVLVKYEDGSTGKRWNQ